MKDQWLQVSIRTTHEATEAVADLLREAGARNGVEIEDPLLLEQLRKKRYLGALRYPSADGCGGRHSDGILSEE